MRKLAVVVVCLVGCGGSVSIDALDQEYAKTYCDVLVRCGLVDNVALCDTLYFGVRFDTDLIAAVHQGKVIYHDDKAQDCLDSLEASSCKRTDLFGAHGASEACDEMFEGTVGQAGACALNAECISGDCSVPTCGANSCCQGMCRGGTPPDYPLVGQACLDTPATSHCVASFCNPTTGTCAPFKPSGSSCGSSTECESGTTCMGSVCTNLSATGGPCNNSQDCLDLGDTCTAAGICVAVGLTGDPCTNSGDCSGAYTCDATNHCVLKPTLGHACSGSQSACIDDSFCDFATMTCTAPQADGAACFFNRMCASNDCDAFSQICTTPAVCI